MLGLAICRTVSSSACRFTRASDMAQPIPVPLPVPVTSTNTTTAVAMTPPPRPHPPLPPPPPTPTPATFAPIVPLTPSTKACQLRLRKGGRRGHHGHLSWGFLNFRSFAWILL